MLGTTRSIVAEERAEKIKDLEEQLTEIDDLEKEIRIRNELVILYRHNLEFDESTSHLVHLRTLDPKNSQNYGEGIDHNNSRKDRVKRAQQTELVERLYTYFGNDGD